MPIKFCAETVDTRKSSYVEPSSGKVRRRFHERRPLRSFSSLAGAPDRARELTLGIHMHTTILAILLEFSRTAVSMCSAGILLFLIALWASRADIARARGLDKIVALSNLCFAIPLAVFGALHLSAAEFRHAPGALVHAMASVLGIFRGLRVAGRVLEHCHKNSGALVRPAVRDHDVSFCGDVDIPGALASPRDRLAWTFVFREMSFGGGGWILAGNAMQQAQGKSEASSSLWAAC